MSKIEIISKYKRTFNVFFYTLIGFILSFNFSFADGGILGNFKGTSEETEKAIREGNINLTDIPIIIKGAIDFLMVIAGTIAIIFVIIGAYLILFGSLEQDKTKGKDTIIMAIVGFMIASLSWFIIKLVVDNLS